VSATATPTLQEKLRARDARVSQQGRYETTLDTKEADPIRFELLYSKLVQAVTSAHEVARMVILWCGSTEIFMQLNDVHKTLRWFEEGLKNDHPAITPSMIYAYASLMSGVPFGNGDNGQYQSL
jgi:myo-inositol-1-phosphate synthase